MRILLNFLKVYFVNYSPSSFICKEVLKGEKSFKLFQNLHVLACKFTCLLIMQLKIKLFAMSVVIPPFLHLGMSFKLIQRKASNSGSQTFLIGFSLDLHWSQLLIQYILYRGRVFCEDSRFPADFLSSPESHSSQFGKHSSITMQ